MSKSNKAFFPSGHWASNIGNAFFNLGTRHLLETAGLKVTDYDLPPYKAFGTWSGNVSKAHYYVDNQAKFLVLDGPMFDMNFANLFEPYLAAARRSGMKIALLSTGMINYDESERRHCLQVLEKYKPEIITTRDSKTYEVMRSAAAQVYDGICHAWFVPEAFSGFETKRAIASVFDHTPEPTLANHEDFVRQLLATDVSGVTPPFSVKHSNWTKISRLLQRNFEGAIGDVPIIRACHQVLARGNWRLFYKPEIVCAQTPYIYLNIYRNSLLTITDRLHASVATLAYGNPAILFNKSNRCYLLDRMGLTYAGGRVMRLDPEKLSKEKANYTAWLTRALSDAGGQ